VLNKGDYANIATTRCCAADIKTGEIRRFLTGPRGSEITGIITTPMAEPCHQHPAPGRSREAGATIQDSAGRHTWPMALAGGRPRSATMSSARRRRHRRTDEALFHLRAAETRSRI